MDYILYWIYWVKLIYIGSNLIILCKIDIFGLFWTILGEMWTLFALNLQCESKLT